MPAPRYRSRTMRRVKRRTPGGRLALHYRRRNTKKLQCSSCGKTLSGTVRGRSSKIKKVPKSARRPQRAYGGQYCSACSRRIIIKSVRQ